MSGHLVHDPHVHGSTHVLVLNDKEYETVRFAVARLGTTPMAEIEAEIDRGASEPAALWFHWRMAQSLQLDWSGR